MCIFFSFLELLKMDTLSFEDLQEHFLSESQVLQTVMKIRNYSEDDTCIEKMEVVTFYLLSID